MTAHEAYEKSITPQYEVILELINQALRNRKTSLVIIGTKLFSKVAEILAKDGYDILIDSQLPGFRISWENATMEHVSGTIQEGTLPKIIASTAYPATNAILDE